MIYRVLKRFFGKSISLNIFSTIFLPGTFMHEISHYLMARMLFVPVGKFNLKAEFEDDGVQLGSVSIAKTDPIRRFLIGIAPVLLGMLVVLILSNYLKDIDMFWLQAIIAFFVFIIANSMFSSRKDMEGAIKLFITIILFVMLFNYVGVNIKISIPEFLFNNFQEFIRTGVGLFIIPLGINFSVLLFSDIF